MITKPAKETSHGIGEWMDISVAIRHGMVHWPKDATVKVKQTSSIEKGADANVTELSMSAHTATHVDAQRHFIQNGKDITQIALNKLIGIAKVLPIQNERSIGINEIK